MEVIVAVRLREENIPAIRSEYPGFDEIELRKFLADHGDGYFVRDESADGKHKRPFDCRYFSIFTFAQVYAFEDYDPSVLFHKISRLP